MKEGWEIKKFNEICVLQSGYDLPTRLRKEGAYPLVSSNGVTDKVDVWKVKGPEVVTGRSGTMPADPAPAPNPNYFKVLVDVWKDNYIWIIATFSAFGGLITWFATFMNRKSNQETKDKGVVPFRKSRKPENKQVKLREKEIKKKA